MRASKGFTFAELLITSAIAAILLAGTASVFFFSFRRQSVLLRSTVLGNNATMLHRSLRTLVAEASLIAQPPTGGAGAELTVWHNVDPVGGGAIVPGEQRRVLRLCLHPDGRRVFLHEARLPDDSSPPLVPSGGCGDDWNGTPAALVAGGAMFAASLQFTRPEPDLVQLSYSIETTQEPGLPERAYRRSGTDQARARGPRL